VNLGLYLVGFLVFVGGVAWGLSVMGVSSTYIVIACLVMLGLGIMTGVTRTRMKDPPST
jgi:hypothetical protein